MRLVKQVKHKECNRIWLSFARCHQLQVTVSQVAQVHSGRCSTKSIVVSIARSLIEAFTMSAIGAQRLLEDASTPVLVHNASRQVSVSKATRVIIANRDEVNYLVANDCRILFADLFEVGWR